MSDPKSESPWVSVKDQLPTVCDSVFVALEEKNIHDYAYLSKDGCWKQIMGSGVLLGVTHWMPIPPIEKGKE